MNNYSPKNWRKDFPLHTQMSGCPKQWLIALRNDYAGQAD